MHDMNIEDEFTNHANKARKILEVMFASVVKANLLTGKTYSFGYKTIMKAYDWGILKWWRNIQRSDRQSTMLKDSRTVSYSSSTMSRSVWRESYSQVQYSTESTRLVKS